MNTAYKYIAYKIALRYGELCTESGFNFLVHPVNLLICKQENNNLKKKLHCNTKIKFSPVIGFSVFNALPRSGRN
jgi:hypothetical protein